MASPLAVVADAHHIALEVCCRVVGKPVQGLTQAARLLRHRLPTRQCRGLRELDLAYAYLRHITDIHISAWLQDLERDLAATSPSRAVADARASDYDKDSAVARVGGYSAGATGSQDVGFDEYEGIIELFLGLVRTDDCGHDSTGIGSITFIHSSRERICESRSALRCGWRDSALHACNVTAIAPPAVCAPAPAQAHPQSSRRSRGPPPAAAGLGRHASSRSSGSGRGPTPDRRAGAESGHARASSESPGPRSQPASASGGTAGVLPSPPVAEAPRPPTGHTVERLGWQSPSDACISEHARPQSRHGSPRRYRAGVPRQPRCAIRGDASWLSRISFKI